MLATYRRYFALESAQLAIADWEEAILHARKYLPFCEQHTPRYVEELAGMADGAQVEFNDLLVLNCTEAITEDALHTGCTSLAVAPEVTADGSVLVGHNEDCERQQTIASLLMDLNTRTMHVAWGTPCQAPYHPYQLDHANHRLRRPDLARGCPAAPPPDPADPAGAGRV